MEQYFNNFATVVAAGGYTAGSGVLNVGASSPITLNAGDTTHLLVFRVISGTPTFIVLLQVTAVNSGTQFAVTAESADSNALANDNVVCVYSAGGIDQIRQDINGYGATSAVPTNASRVSGSRYKVKDGNFDYVYDAGSSLWVPYFRGIQTAIPNQTFSWINQTGASITTETDGSLYLAGTANSSTGMQVRVFSAPGTPYKYKFIVIPLLPAAANPEAGILFSDGTALSEINLTMIVSGSSVYCEMTANHWTNATTFSAALTIIHYFHPANTPIVLGMSDDGTNRKFYYYPDGYTEITVFTETRTTFLTATKLGFFYNDNNANVGGGIIVPGIERTI
jgi:hypothetical protein